MKMIEKRIELGRVGSCVIIYLILSGVIANLRLLYHLISHVVK